MHVDLNTNFKLTIRIFVCFILFMEIKTAKKNERFSKHRSYGVSYQANDSKITLQEKITNQVIFTKFT